MRKTTANDDLRPERAVRAIVVLSREFERVCRDAGVSLPQYRLLLFLRRGPKRAGELAARVAVKRPTLSALVAGLEKEGRVRRVAVELDGRGVRLDLTRKGQAALKRVEAELTQCLERTCAAGDRESMLDAFDALAQIVEREVAARTTPAP